MSAAAPGSATRRTWFQTGLARAALRGAALAIVALAWLDPSLASRARPRVAVLDAGTGGPVARVRAALDDRVAVTIRPDPAADAWVVVARDEDSPIPDAPANTRLWLVTDATPAAALVVEAIDAPARVGRGARARVTATFVARGLKGTRSTLALRAGSQRLARVEHEWRADDERFDAGFDVVLPVAGANHLVVEAVDDRLRSPRARGDVLVDLDDRPLPVLVFEGRPSWTTTFARRALERDERFAVALASRVSRGLGTMGHAGDAPATRGDRASPALTARLLDAVRVAIVGAPEALTDAEVAALDVFVQAGGALVLAPDRRPEGAYLRLLGQPAFDERLLEEPIAMPLAEAGGLDLLASEIALARVLPPGARPLTRPRPPLGAAPGIWSLAVGDGQIVFLGTLDAWRFRSRPASRFDAWWPQVVDWLGAQAPPELAVTLDRPVVEPGAPIAVQVRLRAPDGAVAVRAALESGTRPTPTPAAGADPVRLWPAAEPGTFTGRLNAPLREGVYALSATATGAHGTRGDRAALVVAAGARPARPADARWQATTASRRGGVTTVDDLAGLTRALEAGAAGDSAPEPRFPMRSPWWLVPLTACLGGEWWLRRRAGLR